MEIEKNKDKDKIMGNLKFGDNTAIEKIRVKNLKPSFDGLSYFERITLKSQPHEIKNLDWKNYYSLQFADTFLPKVDCILDRGFRFYDGAEIIDETLKIEKDEFLISKSQYLHNVLLFSFPTGVEAEKKKDRVNPSSHETFVFIEVDKEDDAHLSFKFGTEFKKMLSKNASNYESTKYTTSVNELKKYFGNTINHNKVTNLIFQVLGEDESLAYSNTDIGKLEAILKKEKVLEFIIVSKCDSNSKVVFHGKFENNFLIFKRIETNEISSLANLDFKEKENGLLIKRNGVWINTNFFIPNTNLNCRPKDEQINENEIGFIKNAFDNYFSFTKKNGQEKLYYEILNEIQKKLSNDFYKNVKLCVNLSVVETKIENQNKVIDQSPQINVKKNDYTGTFSNSEEPCEVVLHINVNEKGVASIKHELSPTYLEEYKDKWIAEVKRRGLEKHINIEELRQQVISDFTNAETEKSFYQTFIQEAKALLNENIGGYVEAIQSTQKVAKNVWEEGQVNESTWHSNKDDLYEEHQQWPTYVRLEPVIGGATDGVIDEIVGIPMAIKGIYGIATDEKQREAIKKLFTKEGLSNILDGLKDEVDEIKNDDQKAGHFGAKTTVTVVTMFFGVGFITKTGKIGDAITTVTNKAVKAESAKVMKTIKELKDWFKYKPDGRKIIDDYKNEFGEDAIVDMATEASEDIDLLDEIKVRPQNFINGKKFEKNIEKLIDAGDEKFLTKIAYEAGISFDDLAGYTKLKQVQINLPDGGFTVADNVWVKNIKDTRGNVKSYDIIINENKLSKATDFTKRQTEFINDIGNTSKKFTIRSKKDEIPDFIPQNNEINIKAYIKTSGNGNADNINDLLIKKVK